MNPPSFPQDDYTPYGYLDNPFDAGPWVGLESGGVLRSLSACGFGWFHPQRDPPEGGGLRLGLELGGRRLLETAELEAAGLRPVSRYHSSRVQSFELSLGAGLVRATFVLGSADALLARCRLEGPVEASLLVQLRVGRGARRNAWAGHLSPPGALAALAEPGPWYALGASVAAAGHRLIDDGRVVGRGEHVVGEAYSPAAGWLGAELVVPAADVPPDGLWCALGRGASAEAALQEAWRALPQAEAVLSRRLEEDAAFWGRAPHPVGDWPASWRRGWVYDLETTRLMLRPPAGVFHDLWPTWQLFRPRVVLAENALDMMRLACADPAAARRALSTAFREAPQANLPCLFANGSLNMVAEGGDACGTSPAWCLPFHCLYLLYLWDPDREWLRTLYPALEAYLDWWLEHRRDEQGWMVYRCTWESGEDGTPRLDWQRTGHRDIAREVRPVELQAAMAHSALLLVRLGRELGRREAELGRWRAVAEEYTRRTRALWDPAQARFRDQYLAEAPRDGAEAEYWGARGEESPLQLLPLLYAVATPEQARALAPRLHHFLRPPYTWWPSWTFTLAEVARAAGEYQTAARLAHQVLSRVYPALDRREGADMGARPGTSREWWPDDLAQNTVHNECYGWGATTATLFLRHVLGFGPAETTEELAFELVPCLPPGLLRPGRRCGFANLHYRGTRLDLDYQADAAGLGARLVAAGAGKVVVTSGGQELEVSRRDEGFRFRLQQGERHLVQLIP